MHGYINVKYYFHISLKPVSSMRSCKQTPVTLTARSQFKLVRQHLGLGLCRGTRLVVATQWITATYYYFNLLCG